MDALEALKLARETGVKVRPKGVKSYYHYLDGARGKRLFFGSRTRAIAIAEEYLFDSDGSFFKWEIAPTINTNNEAV